MKNAPISRSGFLAAIGLSVFFLALSGCDRGPKPVDGDSLNPAFPNSGGGFEVVFTQEKDGFVQALLKQEAGEEESATLTISDLIDNPAAKTKFEGASMQIAGFPAAASGSQGTAMLVADRYQVQVRSKTPDFDESARKAWLEKFNFGVLAKLKDE